MDLCDGVCGGGSGVEGDVLIPACFEGVFGGRPGIGGGVLLSLSLISSLMSPFGVGIEIECFETSGCDFASASLEARMESAPRIFVVYPSGWMKPSSIGVAHSGLVKDSGGDCAELGVSGGVSAQLTVRPDAGTGPKPGIIHSSVTSCISPDGDLIEIVRADLETVPCEGLKVPVIRGTLQSS